MWFGVVAMWLVMPQVSGAATLTLGGSCPGSASIEAGDLAGRDMVLLLGSGEGAAPIPGGPCRDVDSGLAGPLRWFGPFADADGDGEVTLLPTLPLSICGSSFVALDVATCEVSAPATFSPPVPDTCETVDGITWCYHPSECGMACNDTCAAVGRVPMADSVRWFEAQNEVGECETIAAAFGAYSGVEMNGWSYGCVNDGHASDHSAGPTPNLTVPWLCSTYDGCPASILTNLDQLGVACGLSSRMAVCACE
jgi:hypothetical protein